MLTCPRCHKEMFVVCSDLTCTCYKRVPEGALPMVNDHEADTQTCPYCQFTEHIDFWEEREMDEFSVV